MVVSTAKRFPTRILRSATLVVVGMLFLGSLGCKGQTKTSAPPPPVVEFANPITDKVTDEEEFTGRTDAIASAEIRARVTGYLEVAYFKDGAFVKKGDPLFKIDDSIFKATLAREEANVQQAKARMERSTADFKRLESTNAGSVTPQERDTIVANKAESDAAYASAVATRQLAEINLNYSTIVAPFAGRMSRRLVDPGNLVKADETPLTTIVSLNPIFAYFDVDERTVLRFRRLLDQRKISSSNDIEIPVQIGVADEEGFSLKGSINFVDNHLDSGTGTLRVRARVENKKLPSGDQYFLSPGMFIRVRLPVGEEHPVMLVPERAISTDQGQKVLFVIVDGDVVEKLNIIKIGPIKYFGEGPDRQAMRVVEQVEQPAKESAQAGEAESPKVLRGLTTSDRVIVTGQQRVRKGVTVNPKPVKAVVIPPAPEKTPKPSAGL